MKAERWVIAEGKRQDVEEGKMKPTEWLTGKAAME